MGTQRGYSKRGTHEYSTERRNCFGFLRQVLTAGYWRAVHGSVGHTGAVARVVWPYVSGAHGALTQRVLSSAVPAGGCCARMHRHCAWAATEAYPQGASSVLTWYSHGTHVVLSRYCATPLGTRHSFVRVWPSLWDLGPLCPPSSAEKQHTRPSSEINSAVLGCASRTVRGCSADPRSDGHARADQPRRHQPAHARADAWAELCRPDGYVRWAGH